MYSLYIKFQEKIFTGKRIIQLWNFGNFGIPEIIPKILVTLRFSKISLHELNGNYKCFKMRYWPHFYVDPTHSNTHFSKVGIWRVLLQGTVSAVDRIHTWAHKVIRYLIRALDHSRLMKMRQKVRIMNVICYIKILLWQSYRWQISH